MLYLDSCPIEASLDEPERQAECGSRGWLEIQNEEKSWD